MPRRRPPARSGGDGRSPRARRAGSCRSRRGAGDGRTSRCTQRSRSRARRCPSRARSARQRRRQLPAEHTAGEHIDDEHGIDPAREGAPAGDIRDPQLVRGARGEVPFDQVKASVRAIAGKRDPRALLSSAPAKSFRRHQWFHGAARDHDAFSAQLNVELLRPVDPEVLRMDTANLDQQLHVPNRPLQGRAGLESVVGARRDLGARCGERAADRLDAQLLLVLVVVPGRWPSSISACRTHVRNVSGWIPSCSPTRRNAAGLVAGSSRTATAVHVALPGARRGTSSVLTRCSSSRGITASTRPGAIHAAIETRLRRWEFTGVRTLACTGWSMARCAAAGETPPPLADSGDRDRRLGDELWQDPSHHRVPPQSSGLDR